MSIYIGNNNTVLLNALIVTETSHKYASATETSTVVKGSNKNPLIRSRQSTLSLGRRWCGHGDLSPHRHYGYSICTCTRTVGGAIFPATVDMWVGLIVDSNYGPKPP